MRNLFRTLPILLCFICLAFASEVRADPLLVTGGSAVTDNFFVPQFTLVGDGFVINGGLRFGPGACPCQAGNMLTLRTHGSGWDINGGPAVINGVSYAGLSYAGSITFLSNIVVPNNTASAFTLVTPFEFNGSLSGCTNNQFFGCQPGNQVFDFSLRGQGLATVMFQSIDGGSFGRIYTIQGVRYDFAPVATPEPATMVLLGTGLAGIGAAVRRRRKANRDKNS
jgi:PEP-CTERM motif